MGLGLTLLGTRAAPLPPSEALARAAVWFEREGPSEGTSTRIDEEDGASTLYVSLHPAADEVELTARGAHELYVSAQTSSVGPGYHVALCELLDRFASDEGLAWGEDDPQGAEGDETGYFRSRDRAALEGHMTAWLHTLAGTLLERASRGFASFRVSLPTSPWYVSDAFLLTQLGPRDRAWLEAVAVEPVRGLDVFPWWPSGQGAAYLLGRALTHMWLEVPWRAPLDDDERGLMEHVDALLLRAHAMDASFACPWREWAELLQHLDASGEHPAWVRSRARDAKEGRLVGYLRGDVRHDLAAGWTMCLPGRFAAGFEESTWSAFDGARTVWATCFQKGGKDGAVLSAQEMLSLGAREGAPVELPGLDSRLARRADFVRKEEEDGDGYWMLSAQVAAPGRLCAVTVCVPSEAELPFAVRVVESLQHRD